MKLNTKKYEKTIKQIIIDDRENERKKTGMELYAPFHPTIQHLPTGDYIFKGHNNITAAFEYKKITDFLTSIDPNENHLHNQVYRMIQNYDYCFVIIECENLSKALTKRFYQTGISTTISQVNGVVSELNTVCTVLWGQSVFSCFDLMMRTAGKIIEDKPFLYKFGRKSPNTALNRLNCIHGLRDKALDIVNTLDLHTLTDLQNLTVNDLMQVDGIGKATAIKILEEIGS